MDRPLLPAVLVVPKSVGYYDTLMFKSYIQIIKYSVRNVFRTVQLQKVAYVVKGSPMIILACGQGNRGVRHAPIR